MNQTANSSSHWTPTGARLLGLVVAAAPLLIAALGSISAPTFRGGMFSEPATVLGIPHELVVWGFAIAWGAIGGYAVGTSRSRWALPSALFAFTVPACFAILLAPVIVLILQNAAP